MKPNPIKLAQAFFLFCLLFPSKNWSQTFSISETINCEVSLKDVGLVCRASKGKAHFKINFTSPAVSGQMITLYTSNYINSTVTLDKDFTIQLFGTTPNGIRISPVIYADETHHLLTINDQTYQANIATKNLPFAFHQPISSIEVTILHKTDEGHLFLNFSEPVDIPTTEASAIYAERRCPYTSALIALDVSGSVSEEDAVILQQYARRVIDTLVDSQIDTLEVALFNSNLQHLSDAGISSESRKEYWSEIITRKIQPEGAVRPNSMNTNWEQILDLAIAISPDIVILLSDGYPNWYENQRHTLDENYDRLTKKSDVMNAKGTILLLGLLNMILSDHHDLLLRMTGNLQSNQNSTMPNQRVLSLNSEVKDDYAFWLQDAICPLFVSEKGQLVAYPSPAKNIIFIKSDGVIPAGTLLVFSGDGKLVRTIALPEALTMIELELDLNWLPGVYHLQLNTVDTQFTGSVTIIK